MVDGEEEGGEREESLRAGTERKKVEGTGYDGERETRRCSDHLGWECVGEKLAKVRDCCC